MSHSKKVQKYTIMKNVRLMLKPRLSQRNLSSVLREVHTIHTVQYAKRIYLFIEEKVIYEQAGKS